jgi:hypothetical protein
MRPTTPVHLIHRFPFPNVLLAKNIAQLSQHMQIKFRLHIFTDVKLFETSLILHIFKIIFKKVVVWIYELLVYFYEVFESVLKEHRRVNMKSFHFFHIGQL